MARTHRTEEQTRTLVAEAVIHHVADHGIAAVPELPMERILEQAGVSRASAYRIWPGRSAFSAFALEQCAAGHAIGTLDPSRAYQLAREALAGEDDRLTSAARFVTAAADEELTVMVGSERWRAFIAFQAIAVQAPSEDIRRTLAHIDDEDTARLTSFYSTVAQTWSLRVRDETTLQNIASGALLIARSTVARAVTGTDVPHARESYLAALGALVRGSFQANPDAEAKPHLWVDETATALRTL